ncbi:hypothetical protein ACFQHO_08380 [Actinomadura yumaensis]|uniref:hypothetical protein n=1 Tax=Actinomadura yumaensis TaxID=111807 RepID=UPI0036129490
MSQLQAARTAMDLMIGNTLAPEQLRGIVRDLANRDLTVRVGRLRDKGAGRLLNAGNAAKAGRAGLPVAASAAVLLWRARRRDAARFNRLLQAAGLEDPVRTGRGERPRPGQRPPEESQWKPDATEPSRTRAGPYASAWRPPWRSSWTRGCGAWRTRRPQRFSGRPGISC